MVFQSNTKKSVSWVPVGYRRLQSDEDICVGDLWSPLSDYNWWPAQLHMFGLKRWMFVGEFVRLHETPNEVTFK